MRIILLIGELIYCKSKFLKNISLLSTGPHKCRSTHTRFPVDSHDRELLSNILFVFVCTENELGETALDVSRRLKHGHCEALVRRRSSACLYMSLHVAVERYSLYYKSEPRCVLAAASGPVQPIRPSCERGVRVEASSWRPLRQWRRLWREGNYGNKHIVLLLSFFLYNYSLLLELILLFLESRLVNHS